MNAAGISPNMFPRPLRTPTLSLGVSLFVLDSMSAAHTKDKPLRELGAGAAAIAFKANYTGTPPLERSPTGYHRSSLPSNPGKYPLSSPPQTTKHV